MESIIGTWTQIEGQPYPGLAFTFQPDGSFSAVYAAMGVTSGGTYTVHGNQIDMNQTEHSFGLVGQFIGCYAIEGKVLKLNVVSAADHDRPQDLAAAITYEKIEE